MAKKEKINELKEQEEESTTPIYDEAEARMILGI
jgi:hypothetical protein